MPEVVPHQQPGFILVDKGAGSKKRAKLLAKIDGKNPLDQYSFPETKKDTARAWAVAGELNKLFYLDPFAATAKLGSMASAPAAMENLVGPRIAMAAPVGQARGAYQLGLNLGRNGFLTGAGRALR